MSTLPTFDQIDHRNATYSGILPIIKDELRLGDRYDIWLDRVAKQYDSYCTLRDRPHKLGDWLKEKGDSKWDAEENFFSPERQFHLNAIRQQLNWKDAGRDPDRRNYMCQIGSIIKTTQDTPFGALDEQRDYNRDISKKSAILSDGTKSAKIIYIGGYEYICRNKMQFKVDTGSKTVWWDHIMVEEPDGSYVEIAEEGKYAIMASRLRNELTVPDGVQDWTAFAEKHLLPGHIVKYGFMQPIEHHMGWVEEHIMGIGPDLTAKVSTFMKSEAEAARVDERLAYYEANATVLF
ncbi:MAG: hypothetical protein NXH70_02305 [Hyphomonas sp.]|nr:hypothetical protein [Hyphomonas sp.]